MFSNLRRIDLVVQKSNKITSLYPPWKYICRMRGISSVLNSRLIAKYIFYIFYNFSFIRTKNLFFFNIFSNLVL